MDGLDQHTRPALYFVVRDRSMPRCIRLGRQGFAHFPFAKIEAVAQYESQRLFGRASGIAGKSLQAALLGRAKKQRGHGQLPVQLVYLPYHSRLFPDARLCIGPRGHGLLSAIEAPNPLRQNFSMPRRYVRAAGWFPAKRVPQQLHQLELFRNRQRGNFKAEHVCPLFNSLKNSPIVFWCGPELRLPTA